MPRLLINPGTAAAREISLKPGKNTIGRSSANDITITEGSVSGCHCEIIVDDNQVTLKDLHSTNGTFINRAPIQEAILEFGQTIQLGQLQMLFADEAPTIPQSYAKSIPAVRITQSAPQRESAVEIPPPRPSHAVASGPCKNHPKSQARYFCHRCGQLFCDFCVTTRQVAGVSQKFCRTCNVQCTPAQFSAPAVSKTKGFIAMLPEAFVYPFRGTGMMILIAGAIIFGALNWLAGGTRLGFIPRMFGWSIVLVVAVYGYLFSFMQNIIHSTAVGEKELPPLPGMGNLWEDIVLPFLQFLVLILVCFAPAVVLLVLAAPSALSAAMAGTSGATGGMLALLAVGAALAGLFYFPMAFLAVAILDSVMAANPLVVLRSIFKVPLEYLATLVVLAALVFIEGLGDMLMPSLFPRGLTTHSTSKLLGYLAFNAFWGIAGLYLLTVQVRILGLLYLTKKNQLGWQG